ncbi:MAG: tRNA guanosine(34) transglycosylase Tgt [Treponema sp.]|jgi:queuine tRNA-ribosyltransferase|nr:tRNA guanosine(34) transglycosylase Tgt [Treponema sp.]
MSIFEITKKDRSSGARNGILKLPHGTVRTPVFMPVGTNGTVKALSNGDLEEIGFTLILANTYHLYLRPGTEVISAAGGLREFTKWRGNYLTDSGGFQVFSLAPFRKITGDGVCFQSHIDGSRHFLTPEKAVELQVILGSDIQMQLDVCSPWGIGKDEAKKALDITAGWLTRAKDAWLLAKSDGYEGALFSIVQGGFYKDLREESAAAAAEADTPGIAVGGLSVGEPEEVFFEYLAFTASLLPEDKPRYVMGIGTPEYILEAVENGIDMFDCVLPTRTARNGRVFSRDGTLSIKKAENTVDLRPIDEECSCKVCRTYSRAYLRHLFKTGEILCSMLASYHNLYFLRNLVSEARNAINEGTFAAYKKNFLRRYRGGSR